MRASTYDLEIDQGSDFAVTLTLRQPVLNSDGTVHFNNDGTVDRDGDPVVLTGYSFRAQIRKYAGDTLVDAFVCTIMSETLGTVQLALTKDQTVLFIDSDYVYDVEATIDGTVRRVIQGRIKVTPEVTEDEVVPV